MSQRQLLALLGVCVVLIMGQAFTICKIRIDAKKMTARELVIAGRGYESGYIDCIERQNYKNDEGAN